MFDIVWSSTGCKRKWPWLYFSKHICVTFHKTTTFVSIIQSKFFFWPSQYFPTSHNSLIQCVSKQTRHSITFFIGWYKIKMYLMGSKVYGCFIRGRHFLWIMVPSLHLHNGNNCLIDNFVKDFRVNKVFDETI